MRRAAITSALTLAVASGSVARAAEPPVWTKDEMKQLFGVAQQSAQQPTAQARDLMLLQLAAQAYRVQAVPGETPEHYAERILDKRAPGHPRVKAGQELTALMRQFYADASVRAGQLARFERDRADRQYFEAMSQQAGSAADTLGRQLQVVVEGLEDAIEPLPVIKGQPPEKIGALAIVKGPKIVLEGLDRVTFVDDRPKADEPRTAKGALKELFSAQKQYNIQSQMFGQYDAAWRKNGGHIRAVVPARRPAVYLNEIVRAGVPAGMHTLHVMTMDDKGALAELVVAIGDAPRAPKKRHRRKKRKKNEDKGRVDVSCADDVPMELCAKKIAHAATLGTPRFVVD